ncbi:MAG TPA: 7-cyano-7-deazaguanine synthase QueC [Pyrinomonadaceae bacterium]|jgi:7-cyano-7-deazaguanine synthase|nr:7-cyano-7-deazaguanine synthase QueC [Pyrinomonadaceae bacterium]
MGGYDEKAFDELETEASEREESGLDAEASDSALSPQPSALDLAVCLVSGGMDSCVTAAIAATEHVELAFLHASYGQRTESREARAFQELAEHYRVTRRLVASLDYLARIGGSSLTDAQIPVAAADLSARVVPTSYVPFRNAHLLAIAASWAEVLGAHAIYIGAVAEDSSGYPDCRPEFYAAFQQAIDTGTRPETRVEIKTPVIHLRKAEIIRRGLELGAPLALTWSCYQAEERACGRCDSCALRLRAFKSAGAVDPVPYA